MNKLNSCQQRILNGLTKHRYNSKIIVSGRQSGKSQIYHHLQQWINMQQASQPKCEIINQAKVDRKTWYTISCRKDVSMWIRENGAEKESWFEHIDPQWYVHKNIFDVSEEFYMLIVLRFGR